jgi:Arc/MetJ family transcription regulator
MPIHTNTTMIEIDLDLLPQMARALRALNRENISLSYVTDSRLMRLSAELDEAATTQLTDPAQQTYYNTAQAASILGISARSVRRQANTLEAVRQGNAWYYPRDTVNRLAARRTLKRS